jgi:hypothetical protein
VTLDVSKTRALKKKWPVLGQAQAESHGRIPKGDKKKD